MKKKSILFIADKPNWAYEFMVTTWLPWMQEYDCYIAYAQDFHVRSKKISIKDIFAATLSNILKPKDPYYKIDASRHFSYPVYKNPPVFSLPDKTRKNITHFDTIVEMAYYFQMTAKTPFTANKHFVGIFTDGYPHEGPEKDFIGNYDYRTMPREAFYKKYLARYNGIIAGCNNIVRAYRPVTDKIRFTYGIYKQEGFGKTKTPHEIFTIGWTGNPNREMKGFNEVIVPAIEKVRSTGRNIRLKTKFSGPYEELFDFYNDVDLVLIASRADSGPSLFAEASLSDVPCISTAVGLPEMMIEHDKNGLIVNRDIDEFANAIIKLYDDREKLHQFSLRIKADYLKIMDNELRAKNFKQFIETY